ncbi:SusC/RagA family TonB-linked outer membrane protein [Sinomicrobium weinanense]|uniref:TonB-dependent receptor n=1 Tax=Sinomicrobium weinanense TaxID=2842200 RepID=A0A926JW73_9FLAO|nr:TonB-dependent receptor [Sinomicrobium weinanense]MBC9798499.1 TonB-dependent receptor [Sinomicrobium weinanense]MBU3126012.1 TonB-dependent receptor [Sinomicrobium weinanense]
MRSNFTQILTLLLAFIVQFSFAQEKTITGNVTDQGGVPLPGVNIVIKGTATGTQTDFDGNYSITAAEGQVLQFTYIGMTAIEKTVGASNTVDVVMANDTQALEEVVVLGYRTMDRSKVTGSSDQIQGGIVEDIPVVTVDQALQGKVAGVAISQTSGTPGSAQNIRIRGVSSITANNEPLYVIDGVPVMNSNISGSVEDDGSAGTGSSISPLAAINSKDIESITVLKDASATAAYGARGTNGVIVITTKKGKEGKVSFDFSSAIGIRNDAYNKRRPLTGAERIMLTEEAVYNSYSKDNDFTREEAYDFMIENNIGGTADWNGKEGDWYDALKNKNAMLQTYNLSARGGSEKSNFYASLGYNKTENTVVSNDFRRITGLLSVNQKLTKRLDFSTSINVSNTVQDALLEQGSYYGNPYLTRYYMSPYEQPYNEDGSYNTDINSSVFNTLYTLANDINRNNLTRGLINSALNWEVIDNLTFKTRFSIDYLSNDYKRYANRYHGDGEATNGYAESSVRKNYNWVSQSSLNYRFSINGDHNFDVTALFEYQKNEMSYVYGYGENFPADGLTNINSASANYDADSQYTNWKNVSYLGMLNYNYRGKYVLDFTYRREGSSRFFPGRRFGDFWSVGGAWNIDDEDFMDDTVFSKLRLRGSYGVTGNAGEKINQYQPLMDFNRSYTGNGAPYPSQYGNDYLSWEKAATTDVGLEFGVLDNRLTGSATYFRRRTYDLLQEVPLSLTTGFSDQTINVGEMVNKGVELQLDFDILRSEDFNWSVSANYATVKNEVTELALDQNGTPRNPDGSSSYKTTEIGLPVGAWYMPTWAGVDPQTGAPQWYVNGVDGEVTSNYSQAERVYQGASPLPKYTGGLSTQFKYKWFFLDASLYYAGGHKIYEQYAQHYFQTNRFTLGSNNGIEELLERWQQPGDITDVPKLQYATNDNFGRTSSRHLYDGDYIRLKDVTIGFNLPDTALEALGVDGVTFTLRGSNLATWVKDSGLKLDPEVRASGYTYLSTPPVKSYVFGVNVKF